MALPLEAMGRPLLLLALLTAMASGSASPARAEWRRAATDHFIIYSEASEARLRALAERLERFDGLLRRLTPVPPSETARPLTVYMPGSIDAVEQLLGMRGAGGFYSAYLSGPYAVAPRRTGDDDFSSDVILFHEYMHHFMLQHFSIAYPPWFVEGYAELFSNTRFERDGSILIGAFADHRGFSLLGTPPPLADLMFNRGRNMPMSQFYAHAWGLTHYLLISEERPGQLLRYIDLIAGGRAPQQAAADAFRGIDALDRDYRRYRRSPRIPTLRLRFEQTPGAGRVAIEPLAQGEGNLLWLRLEYRQKPRGDALAGFARRVRTRVAQTPADPAALQLLADVEALAGDFSAATRAVDALLARHPEAPQALLRKGLIEVALLERDRIADHARWIAAREWLRRANRAAPDDPMALFEYYDAFRREGARPPAPAVAALERAHQLVPQSFDLRILYARELIRARLHARAAGVLAPVAYSAHGGVLSDAATRTIALIADLPDGAEPPAAALTLPPERSRESGDRPRSPRSR